MSSSVLLKLPFQILFEMFVRELIPHINIKIITELVYEVQPANHDYLPYF